MGLLILLSMLISSFSAQPLAGQRAVVLYADANFCGESMVLHSDWSASHPRSYWNDVIASVIVPRGWEVWIYEHTHFRGASIVLTYDWSVIDDPWWRNRISSVRIVPSNRRNDRYQRPNRPGRNRDYYRGRPEVVLYEHSNFNGSALAIRGDWSVRYRDDFWNDRISSIYVPPGFAVILYEHSNFRGRSVLLEGSWRAFRARDWWNDRVSSIQVLRR